MLRTRFFSPPAWRAELCCSDGASSARGGSPQWEPVSRAGQAGGTGGPVTFPPFPSPSPLSLFLFLLLLFFLCLLLPLLCWGQSTQDSARRSKLSATLSALSRCLSNFHPAPHSPSLLSPITCREPHHSQFLSFGGSCCALCGFQTSLPQPRNWLSLCLQASHPRLSVSQVLLLLSPLCFSHSCDFVSLFLSALFYSLSLGGGAVIGYVHKRPLNQKPAALPPLPVPLPLIS